MLSSNYKRAWHDMNMSGLVLLKLRFCFAWRIILVLFFIFVQHWRAHFTPESEAMLAQDVYTVCVCDELACIYRDSRLLWRRLGVVRHIKCHTTSWVISMVGIMEVFRIYRQSITQKWMSCTSEVLNECCEKDSVHHCQRSKLCLRLDGRRKTNIVCRGNISYIDWTLNIMASYSIGHISCILNKNNRNFLCNSE